MIEFEISREDWEFLSRFSGETRKAMVEQIYHKKQLEREIAQRNAARAAGEYVPGDVFECPSLKETMDSFSAHVAEVVDRKNVVFGNAAERAADVYGPQAVRILISTYARRDIDRTKTAVLKAITDKDGRFSCGNREVRKACDLFRKASGLTNKTVIDGLMSHSSWEEEWKNYVAQKKWRATKTKE